MLGASCRWLEPQLGTRRKAETCQNLQRHIPQAAWTVRGSQTPSKDHRTRGHHIHTDSCQAPEHTQVIQATSEALLLRALCLIPACKGLLSHTPDKEQPLDSDHHFTACKPPEQSSLTFLFCEGRKKKKNAQKFSKHTLEIYWGTGKRLKPKPVASRARRDCIALPGHPTCDAWLFPAVLMLTFPLNESAKPSMPTAETWKKRQSPTAVMKITLLKTTVRKGTSVHPGIQVQVKSQLSNWFPEWSE